jgi:hypothetical protein
MSEIMTPGAPTGVPAGYAAQSLTGGFPTIQLSANVAGADVIEFTGTLTAQDIVVVVPQPPFPTQVRGSNLGGSFSGPTTLGWAKIVRNSTVGPFRVLLQGLGGTNTLVIPQGGAMWVYSPDGLLVFAGAQSTSGAVGAIGLTFVFQPTAVPTPDSGNVFHTETSLWAAINAVLGSSGGPITLAIDSSLSPAVFTQAHNYMQRIWLVPDSSAPPTTNVLTIADGALQTDILGGRGPLELACTCATGPALAFTGPRPTFLMAEQFQIKQLGTVPVVNVPTAQIMQVFMFGLASFFYSGTGAAFGVVAGAILVTGIFGDSQNIGNANLVSGAGGTWFNQHDASFPHQTTANFFGATTEILTDQAPEVGYTPAVLVDWSGVSPLTVAHALDRIAAKITPIP